MSRVLIKVKMVRNETREIEANKFKFNKFSYLPEEVYPYYETFKEIMVASGEDYRATPRAFIRWIRSADFEVNHIYYFKDILPTFICPVCNESFVLSAKSHFGCCSLCTTDLIES